MGSDSPRHEIVCTGTGYHPLTRRKVGLAIVDGALSLSEGGQTSTITRAACRPIVWVGAGKMRPMMPLPGLVLDGPGGSWIVATGEMTIDLDGPDEHAAPHPHVWVSADDLARMAGACGIGSTRKPAPPPVAYAVGNPLKWVFGLAALGMLTSVVMMSTMRGASGPADCSRQRQPAEALYPRLSCAEARAELDRVARGEASPRSIVLRPLRLQIDARDVTGPAKVLCDGIEFAAENAGQADPSGPIVYQEGPHAVLAGVAADGRLVGLQTVICGNIVAREHRGEYPQ